MSIVYTCNTYFVIHVIYSGVSGQCSHTILTQDFTVFTFLISFPQKMLHVQYSIYIHVYITIK